MIMENRKRLAPEEQSENPVDSCDVSSKGVETYDSSPYSRANLAHLSRSERKRHREKKRRNDVNKGFDDLVSLLAEIDPNVRSESEGRSQRPCNVKGTTGTQEENILSRVELINRTVEVLKRIHTENEERKMIIEKLLPALPVGANANRSDEWLQGRIQPPLHPSHSFGPQLSDRIMNGNVPTLPSFPGAGPDALSIQAAIEWNHQKMRELARSNHHRDILLSNGNIHHDWVLESLNRLNQTRRAELNGFGSFGANSLSAPRVVVRPIEFGNGGSGIAGERGAIDFSNHLSGITGDRGPIDFSNTVNGITGERGPTDMSQIYLRLQQQYEATASRPSPSNFPQK